MRPVLLFLFIILTTNFCFAQDSKTAFGLKTGLNLSIFSASINSDATFKSGFHLGLYVKTPISENFFFRPELYYSGQGQKDEYITPPNGPSIGNTTTSVNYLNLPLLFETGKKFSFQFGPQIGFLLSGREEGAISNQKVDDDLKDVMKSPDFSLVLGLGLRASDHVHFGVRYNLGLTSIFKAPEGFPGDFPDVKNRVFHFFIAYSF